MPLGSLAHIATAFAMAAVFVLVGCNSERGSVDSTDPEEEEFLKFQIKAIGARGTGTSRISIAFFEGTDSRAERAVIAFDTDGDLPHLGLEATVQLEDVGEESWVAIVGTPTVPMEGRGTFRVRTVEGATSAESGTVKFEWRGTRLAGIADVDPSWLNATFEGEVGFSCLAAGQDGASWEDDPEWRSTFCQRALQYRR